MRGTRDRYRTLAGVALVGAGVVSILGIVTAEALYPDYSTSRQTISALGAGGPGGPVRPAATVFNGAMVFTGLLALAAAAGVHRVYDRTDFTVVVGATALGVLGVGLFPTQTGAPHVVAAFLAFGGGGLSAVLAATVTVGAFRYVSAVLGLVTLAALAGFVALGGSTVLGIGGLERWITYPTQIWVTAFGGYLLGEAGGRRAT